MPKRAKFDSLTEQFKTVKVVWNLRIGREQHAISDVTFLGLTYDRARNLMTFQKRISQICIGD